MPTYQYACTEDECGLRFERVQSFTDTAVSSCPDCTGRVRKVYGSVGVVFKGSGFYRNDSRAAARSGKATAQDGASGGEKASDKSSGEKSTGDKSTGDKPAGDKTSSATSGSGSAKSGNGNSAPGSGSSSAGSGSGASSSASRSGAAV